MRPHKYLPTIGLTYTLDGEPRPALNFSTSVLYQAQRDKKARAAKRQSIRAQQLEAAHQAKARLTALLLRYEQLQQAVATQRAIHAVEQQLFAIAQSEYENQLLAPSDYLQAQRTYLLQQQTLQQKEQQLQLLVAEILAFSYTPN